MSPKTAAAAAQIIEGIQSNGEACTFLVFGIPAANKAAAARKLLKAGAIRVREKTWSGDSVYEAGPHFDLAAAGYQF